MCKTISILKEKGKKEDRVVLLPTDLKIFIENHYKVYVEQGAGLGIGVSDAEYEQNGAEIVSNRKAWRVSPFIVKYKAPIENEFKFLKEGVNLCAIFHAEGNHNLIKTLCEKKITAFSYELFKTIDNLFPLAFVGSEISGKLSIIYGAYHLQSHMGGSGILLSDIIGAKKPKIVVIGYGNAGNAAIRTALALGNDVVVFGTNKERMSKFQRQIGSNVRCLLYDPQVFEEEIVEADLVVGAILISTYNTPSMLNENILKKMKKGSMIIDITCGYGSGYLSTFDKPTGFDTPTYKKYGVLHCKIDILPSSVPKTTSQAFSKNLAPYLLNLGESIFSKKFDFISQQGKIVENGKIVNPIVEENLSLAQKIYCK